MRHLLLSKCFWRGPTYLVPTCLTRYILPIKGPAKRPWKCFCPCYHIGTSDLSRVTLKKLALGISLEGVTNLVSVLILTLHPGQMCFFLNTNQKRNKSVEPAGELDICLVDFKGQRDWSVTHTSNIGTVAWTTFAWCLGLGYRGTKQHFQNMVGQVGPCTRKAHWVILRKVAWKGDRNPWVGLCH